MFVSRALRCRGEGDIVTYIARKEAPADGLLQGHVDDVMKRVDPGRRKAYLHLLRLEGIEISRGELAQREMSEGWQYVLVKGTAIREIGAVPDCCLVSC